MGASWALLPWTQPEALRQAPGRNPPVIARATHLVGATLTSCPGVRTLAVPHNRESPFHRHTRSKAWPWQRALVHTVPFNTRVLWTLGRSILGTMYFFTQGATSSSYATDWRHCTTYKDIYIDSGLQKRT